MIDRNTTIKATEIELCLGIQKSQLADLVRKGVVTKSGRNEYLLLESLNNHRKWIQRGNNANDSDGNVIDYYEQRARKTKAEADALELKNRVINGEFLPVEDVRSDISEAVRICADVLNGFKIRVARIAPEMSDRTLKLIDRESAKCLKALCQLDQNYIEKHVDITLTENENSIERSKEKSKPD